MLYDYLRQFGILKKSLGRKRREHVVHQLAKFKSTRLSQFLEGYAGIAEKHPLVFGSTSGATDVYPDSWAGGLPLDTIKQLALYANRIYVHDPLLERVHDFWNLDLNFGEVIRYPNRQDREAAFRRRLATTIGLLMQLKPLVDAGIVHLSPTQVLTKEREPGAVYASDLYGVDGAYGQKPPELPPEVSRYAKEHLLVRPVDFINGVVTERPANRLSPGRSIAVRFDDDSSPMIFCLSSISVPTDSSHDDDTWKFSTLFDFTGKQSVNEQLFKAWVEGESDKYVQRRIALLENDFFLCSLAKAHFVTPLRSSHHLAQLGLDVCDGHERVSPMPALMQMELPYFQNVSIDDLVKARKNELAFQEFRVALDEAFQEIGKLEDEHEIQKRVDQIYRDLIHLPIARINASVKALRRNVFADLAMAMGTLTSAICSGGNTIVMTAAIAAAAYALEKYKADKSQQDEIRRMPSYFYWDVTRKTRE